MSFASIWFYSERALTFAVPVAFLWAVVHLLCIRMRNTAFSKKRFLCGVLFVFYLSMLVQMTVIRDWQDFFDLTHTNAKTEIILIPLTTTLRDMRKMGVLWELYHIAGNIAFFMPLGFLGAYLFPKWRTWRVMPLTALGLSLLLEISQWVFQTGVSDVDDLILNTLGGCAGFLVWKWWEKRRSKHG